MSSFVARRVAATDRPARRVPPRLCLVVGVVALTVLAFAPAPGNGFVDWDDRSNFLENPHYRGLGRAQMAWAWTTGWLGVYQPLAWMLLEVQYAAVGLDARGYHLASLLIHILDALILMMVTRDLVVRAAPELSRASPAGVAWGSALGTVLFAVHPLRVEVVAWASCQPYLPAAGCAMLCVWSYLRAAAASPRGRPWWLAACWWMFAASLLFKAIGVALPAVLLILDVYPLGRLRPGRVVASGDRAGGVWVEKLPFLILSIVAAALAVWAKHSSRVLVSLEQIGVGSRVVQAAYSAEFYLIKTICPVDLSPIYPRPQPGALPPAAAAALGAAAIAAVAALALRRRVPSVAAAWLAYLALLSPNIGLVAVGTQLVADRYSYLCGLALVPPTAGGIAWLLRPGRWRRSRVAAIAALGIALAAVWITGTRRQCLAWRDSVALARHALSHGAGEHAETHTALGRALVDRGDLEEAEAQFREALRLDPERLEPLVQLGLLEARRGRPGRATAILRDAVRLHPDRAEARSSLGVALAWQGRLDAAVAHLEAAVELDPDDPAARANLERVRALSGRDAPELR